MPGMETQGAPIKQANIPHSQNITDNVTTKKKGVRQMLTELPQAVGMAVMVALLAVSLPIGNMRALQAKTPKAFLRQGDVKGTIEMRLDAASNVLTVAQRAALDETLMQDVRDAMEALQIAKTARAISRADQALSVAVSELTTAELSETDAKSMLRAADNFAEAGSFLRQEGRTYAEKAKKAVTCYESLPMRFLLNEPDMYEGV